MGVLWPIGLVLVLAHTMGGLLPAPVFAAVAVAYLACAVALVRRAGGAGDRTAAALVLAGPALFALAGLTGIPTARHPGAMLANAAVLLAVAVVLLVAATRLALRVPPGPGRAPAALGVLALVVGSGGYLVNLVARWAVVLSGATGMQAAVEDTAWQAHAYLPGLDTAPTFVGLLLVLVDLLQLVYVVLSCLGVAALAVALGRTGALSPSAARWIPLTGVAMTALVAVAAVLAPLLPAPAGTVAAWAGFVLTIPFMSTLLPFAVGIGLLRQHPRTGPAAGSRTQGRYGAPVG
jgi:hypothetical protein